MRDIDPTNSPTRIHRFALSHGHDAFIVAGTVHVLIWAGRDGMFEQIRHVVTTWHELRMALGY